MKHYCCTDPRSLLKFLKKIKISKNPEALYFDRFLSLRVPLYDDEYREYGGSCFCTICGRPEWDRLTF